MSLWLTRDGEGGYPAEVNLWEGKPVSDKVEKMWSYGANDNGHHLFSFCGGIFKNLTGLNLKLGEIRKVKITPTASKQGFIFHLEDR